METATMGTHTLITQCWQQTQEREQVYNIMGMRSPQVQIPLHMSLVAYLACWMFIRLPRSKVRVFL